MTVAVQQKTLGAVFAHLAGTRPETIALRDSTGQAVSYAEFYRRTLQLCAAVETYGLSKGARIAIVAKNSIALAETFGLVRQGLVLTPLNWRLSENELQSVLMDCEPDAIFVDSENLDKVRTCLAALPPISLLVNYDGAEGAFIGYGALISSGGETPAAPEVLETDPLCLIYTSGTTGRPKGAVISHKGALANISVAQNSLLQLTDKDRVLAVMPFFHVGGLWYHFFASFCAGSETTVLPEFNPGSVLQIMERDMITLVHLVPTMIATLIASENFACANLSHLKRIFYAASPMPTAILRKAMDALPDCEFLQSYGSTEAGIISALTPQDHLNAVRGENAERLQSCGRPVAGCEVRIHDNGQPASAGMIGEIEVHSNGVFAGYHDNHAATEAITSGGWVRTGDLGYFDTDGYLFLVDRKSDMIVTGGENVFPTEVEEYLTRMEGVTEAAVFGLPHPKWVEQVTAVVVPEPGATASVELISTYLKSVLAHYKCPKQIFLADALPKNGIGKVLRSQLRIQFQRQSEQFEEGS